MNFIFNNDKRSGLGSFAFFVRVLLVIALSVGLLVLFLSALLWVTQRGVNYLGYVYNMPDVVKVAVVTVGGAMFVALVALYGVHQQNLSAEKRHKIDANLALRKDIFLKVAEAFSVQYEYLLSFSNPTVTDEDRVDLIKGISKEYYKLHLVASEESIVAMLDANQEWMKVVFDLNMVRQKNEVVGIDFLIYSLEVSHIFFKKLWKFNNFARSEFGNDFADVNSYLSEMDRSYKELIISVGNLKLTADSNDR